MPFTPPFDPITGVMGALAQMPLTEVLQNMDFGKRSVRVDVWPEGAEGSVHVHEGQIVYAVATTEAGSTEGESAVLELCRRPGGVFRIHYGRDEVERNVHRPTTFVLLEALRVIDEASAKRNTPAAVDLGLGGPPELAAGAFDAWGDSTNELPPYLQDDTPAAKQAAALSNPLNDPSTSLDIEIASEPQSTAVHSLTGPLPLQQYPRYKVNAVIQVLFGPHTAQLLLEDIGRGGAFLRSEGAPPRGSVITLRLPFTNSELDVPARIVHILNRAAAATVNREPGIGVRFDDLPVDVAARLETFVDQLAREHGGASGEKPQSNRDKLVGYLAESEFLVAAGDLESARRVLSQAQGLAPEDDDVRRKLLGVNELIDAAQANAFIEQAMRGGPQAVELARRATQLRPVRDVLLRSLAVFARGGAHDEVADVAEQLLELDPDDEGALRTLLNANIAMERWSVAARAAESLLRLRPEDQQIRATLQKAVTNARRPV